MPPKEEKKDDKKDDKKEEKAEKKVEGATTDESSTDPEKKGTIPGQNPETGKCEGEDTCAGEGVAAGFSSPANMMDNAKKRLDDSVKTGVKTLMVTLTNPAKCATLAVGSVPVMITGIGNSIAGAFDKITKSINNSATAVKNKGFSGIFAPFHIAHAMFMLKLQGVVNNIALGPDAEIILSNPQLTAKILFDKLVFRSKIYKLALEDAEARGVLKIWIGDYVNSLLILCS